jgi:hypothetical protein
MDSGVICRWRVFVDFWNGNRSIDRDMGNNLPGIASTVEFSKKPTKWYGQPLILAASGFRRVKNLLLFSLGEKLAKGRSLNAQVPGTGELVSDIAALLPGNSVVVRDVASRYGKIDHLVIGENGAIFLIETNSHSGKITEEQGELRHDGRPFEKDFIRQTTTNAFGLREVLEDGLGISPRINAAIVFPRASVEVPRAVCGVEIINAAGLQKWMAKARGNPEVAKLIQAGQMVPERESA